MTQVSLSSGEILDIISLLSNKCMECDNTDDGLLAAYYGKMAQQFETVYDKLQEFVPENRVANLIMAA